MNKLLPFMFTQNLSVDNALSTQQIIHQLITKMNEVTEYVSNWESNYQGYVDEKIQETVTTINKELKDLDSKLTKYIDEAITNERNYVNVWNTNLQVQIDELGRLFQRLLDDAKAELKVLISDTSKSDRAYTDNRILELKTMIADLNQKLEELASKSFASYSPIDGNLKSNEECMQDLRELLCSNMSITWEDLDTIDNRAYKAGYVSSWDSLIAGIEQALNAGSGTGKFYICNCNNLTLQLGYLLWNYIPAWRKIGEVTRYTLRGLGTQFFIDTNLESSASFFRIEIIN